MTTVLLLRGYSVNPYELRPWELLGPEYSVSALICRGNDHGVSSLSLPKVRASGLRDRIGLSLLPPSMASPVAAATAAAGQLVADSYRGADAAFAEADIVHTAELSTWFSADAAARRMLDRRRHHYRLVVTVWETLPLRDSYRTRRARHNRRLVLDEADLFLPTTKRAAHALLAEGVPARKIEVCPPGVDVTRFTSSPAHGGLEPTHVVLSVGRLVWEKGHQDVIRAFAALRRGMLPVPSTAQDPQLVIIGRGPERARLEQHITEMGVRDFARIIPGLDHDAMAAEYADASVLVLASLPQAMGPLSPVRGPDVFWEEQFGMVLVEAMASGLDIIATRSGAIPEVLAGSGRLVDPGDWWALARAIAAGPLRRPPAERVSYPPELREQYSAEAAAKRLDHHYRQVGHGA